MSEYRAGKVIVTNGSNQVSGIGTSWLTYAKIGDTLTVGTDAKTVVSIEGNTNLTLSSSWAGASAYKASYSIETLTESLDSIRNRYLVLINEARLTHRNAKRSDILGSTTDEIEPQTLQKIDEANRYIAAGLPVDTTPYPWVASSAARLGVSTTVIAYILSSTGVDWNTYLANADDLVYAAKADIAVAVDEAAIIVIYEAFLVDLAAL